MQNRIVQLKTDIRTSVNNCRVAFFPLVFYFFPPSLPFLIGLESLSVILGCKEKYLGFYSRKAYIVIFGLYLDVFPGES